MQDKNFEKLGKKEQLLYSLHLCLQETDQDLVHQETVYAKMFELAPKIYQWETNPEWPDWKRCDSQLTSLRKPEHGRMWIIPPKGRLLKISNKGKEEIEKIISKLPKISAFTSKKSQERQMNNVTYSILNKILKSDDFNKWKLSKSPDLAWEDALDCSEYISVLSTTPKEHVINLLTDLIKQINSHEDYKECSEFLNQSIENIRR